MSAEPTTAATDPPAARLTGMQLPGDWTVGAPFERGPAATGGRFSFGYSVSHPKHGGAFLKALDYSAALNSPDVARALQAMTEAFNYERDVLARCTDANLTRVVRAIDSGQITVAGESIPVSYLVFENADRDVREHLASERFEVAWALRSLHHTATGLGQLHRRGIAHQDLKPSNVLLFDGGTSSKIGDLGRAEYEGVQSPHTNLVVAGDRAYAPPEQLYSAAPGDWGPRRQACDLYHLGSMMLFLFADITATAALLAKLDPDHHPGVWNDPYAEVVPYLRAAFAKVAKEFVGVLPSACADELGQIFRELCEPDPEKRGDPQSHASKARDSYSVERYISRFNLLASRAELDFVRGRV